MLRVIEYAITYLLWVPSLLISLRAGGLSVSVLPGHVLDRES